jgi:hypothetical protein
MSQEPLEYKLKEHLNQHFQEQLAVLRVSLEGYCKTPTEKLQLELYLARVVNLEFLEIAQLTGLAQGAIGPQIKAFVDYTSLSVRAGKAKLIKAPPKPKATKSAPIKFFTETAFEGKPVNLKLQFEFCLVQLRSHSLIAGKLDQSELNLLAGLFTFGNIENFAEFLNIGRKQLTMELLSIKSKIGMRELRTSEIRTKLGIQEYAPLTK